MSVNDHTESMKQGDVTPRFTADEASVLILAAGLLEAQGEELLKPESVVALRGATRALIMGQSCPDPMVLVQVGSIPSWMKPVKMAGGLGDLVQEMLEDSGQPQLYRVSPSETKS